MDLNVRAVILASKLFFTLRPYTLFQFGIYTASWIVSRISSIFLIRFCSFLVFLEFLLSPSISLANWAKAKSIVLESTDNVLANVLSCFNPAMSLIMSVVLTVRPSRCQIKKLYLPRRGI